ncbi:MAG: LigA protein, partial [Rhizobacter sp.]|nr:LigA protein [Rhizobacter sp.]
MPSPMDSEGPRRLLIAAGTVHFPGLGDLTQVPEELRRITDSFTAMGYQRQDVDRSLDPTSQVLLDSFSRVNEDSQPGDLVVAYYSGHGVRDAERFYLLALASDPLRLDRTAAAAEDLARALVKGSKAAQVLFILDACYAGAGAAEFAELVSVLTARLGGGPAVFVLAAARPKQEAAQGALTTALARALSNSDERLGGRTQRFLTMEEVMGTVGDELRASHPAQTATLSSVNTDGLTRLFPNPHYRPEIAPGMDLEAQRSFIDHWIPKAGGTEFGSTGWYFTGRETVLSELGTWMRQERSDGRPRVVTGRAGSGKSAVIARIVTLADARYRKTLVPSNAGPAMPPEGVIDVAVHARRKSLADVIRRIASSLSLNARDPVELVEQISRRSAKTVIVVDALDEALDSEEIAARLLRPLAAQPHVFLLVATRPDSVDGGQRFTGFGDASVELDLDSPRYTGAGDVAEYVRRRLVASEEPQRRTPYTDRPRTAQRLAQALAERANKVFLVAHTATLALLADPHPVDPDVPGWTERLPTGIEEAFEQFLAGQDARGPSGLGAALTRAVLLPLAFAEGEGLPWSDLWAAAASRFARQVVSDETVAQVRRQTAAFIVEASEDERSVYRLYHERVAEYLRQSMPASALPQLRMFEALLSRVPALASGERDWRKAHPYLKKHMAAYAAKADALATVIEEPFFLGVADPESLVRHLAALAHSHASIVRAYRRAFGSLRDRSEAERGPYLALALLHEGRPDLAQALTKIDGAAMWTPLWTLWRTTTASHVVARGDSAVSALSTGWWGPGVPVGLVGRESGEVEVWQLTDGRRLAHWKAGIGERVTHVKLLTVGTDRLLVACWASGEIGTHDLQTQTSRFNAEDTGGRSRVEAMCLIDLGPNHGCATFHRDLSLAVWELPSLRLIKRRRKASRAMTYDLAELKTASGSVIVAGGDSVAQHGSGSESRLGLWSTGLKPLWKSDPNESGIVQGLDVV